MLYLLHGDDVTSSRKFLNELYEGLQTTFLDGKSLRIKDFENALFSTNLFGQEKAVIVEGLFSKNAKKKDFILFLNSQKIKVLLIFWEDKKLPKTSFSSLKNVTAKEFSLPQYYFQFLDSFTQGSGKKLFGLHQELLKSMNEELIFYSLLKRMRLLVVISGGGTVADLAKMASWQVSKLQQQVHMWKREQLISFYKELQDTEIKLKTGKLPLGLSKHLDILILTQLT